MPPVPSSLFPQYSVKNLKSRRREREREREKGGEMADKSDMRYKAGEAAGHAQVKKDEMVDSAHGAAQQASGYMQHAGEQVKNMAQGAADTVKNAVGKGGNTTTTKH